MLLLQQRRWWRLRSRLTKTLLLLFAILSIIIATVNSEQEEIIPPNNNNIDYGNHNQEWEDGPTSWTEFGHDNAPEICGLPIISVTEWEEKRWWEGKLGPCIVKNVTDGWAALHNWKK